MSAPPFADAPSALQTSSAKFHFRGRINSCAQPPPCPRPCIGDARSAAELHDLPRLDVDEPAAAHEIVGSQGHGDQGSALGAPAQDHHLVRSAVSEAPAPGSVGSIVRPQKSTMRTRMRSIARPPIRKGCAQDICRTGRWTPNAIGRGRGAADHSPPYALARTAAAAAVA